MSTHLSNPVTSVKPSEPCLTCGVIIREHPRCAGCGILVGPGHLVEAVVNGRCGSCQTPERAIPKAWRQKRRK